jgi:hypothetical protein
MVRSTGATECGVELWTDGQESERSRLRVGQTQAEHTGAVADRADPISAAASTATAT